MVEDSTAKDVVILKGVTGVLFKILLAVFPLLTLSVGFTAKTLMDHDRDLAVIQATRYTPENARQDRDDFQKQLMSTIATYNPAPMQTQLTDLTSKVTVIGLTLKDIDRRLEAVERK